MEARVYVIVVLYNGVQWIDKCFGSLILSDLPLEVIVVDNGSIDGGVDILRNKFPNVTIIESGHNLGFGKANNVGIKKALQEGADFVFLLNQDASIENNSVHELISINKKYPKYGILSPIHLNGDGSELDYNFSTYINPWFTPSLVSDIYTARIKDVYSTSYVNAAAWLISKDCILKTGLFDPIFWHYGEDDDYLHRVKYHGFKVGVVPNVVIYHDRSCKPYSQVKLDLHRAVTADIIKIKNLSGSFKGSFIAFIKEKIDNITTLLLHRNLPELRIQVKSFLKVILLSKKIYRSFYISKGIQAFFD